MNNENGKSFYGIGLDNSQLRSDAAESRAILKSIGDSAVREGQNIDNAFSRIGKTIAGVFTVQQATAFAREIVHVRAEIESLEISFQTLLGSKAKADQLFWEIRQFAVQTPMQLKDLASGAQMLLSFNVEADRVMQILRAIGDVSMGDAQKFNSLTLAFSQMSSTGKLMGQDLLQMINAGFNPLSVISEKTGKSIGVLKEEMAAGKISAEMITQAFIDATSEGGKFFNMLEKQSHGINGAISNLKGAWDDMLNDLGEGSQEAITGTVEGLTNLVKHYDEVGKTIMELVAAYGIYRAALIATEAIQGSYMAVKHADEAAALYQLLSAEGQEKVSKLGLVTTSQEYYAAVQAEILAEREKAAQSVATAKADLAAAEQRLSTVTAEHEAAAQRVADAQAAVAAAQSEAQAERVASLQTQQAKAQEAQSRAALRVVKLQEEKDALIAQATALKEQHASAEVIAAKNRQIAAISQKITAAKAEEVQHGREVIAIRKEIAATAENVTSKKLEREQTILLNAQKELEIAERERSAAAQAVEQAATAKSAASKTAEALATGVDTAAETANATATGFLTLAKNKLAAAAARLHAIIMSNPYAIAAAAVVALGYAIYKMATYQTEAEKATKRLNDATKDMEKSVISEQAQIDILFGRLKAAKEGTDEYEKAKKAIINQYGEYLKGLSNEVSSLKDVEAAYKAVTKAATDAAKARAMEAFQKQEADNYASQMGDVRNEFQKKLVEKFGSKKGNEYYWKIVPVLEGKEKLSKEMKGIIDKFDVTHYFSNGQFGGTTTYVTNDLKKLISTATMAKATFDNVMREAEVRFGEAPKAQTKTEEKKEEIVKNKKYYEELVKAKTQEYENLTKAQQMSRKGRELYNQIREAEKERDALSYSKQSNANTKANTKADSQAATTARETAERVQKIQEYANTVVIAKRQAELDIEQATINAMKDGLEKELRQNELNYEKLVFENQKRMAGYIEKYKDKLELEWENANPDAKKKGLVFDRSQVTEAMWREAEPKLAAQVEQFEKIAKDYRIKANQDALDKMLADVLSYEQQRTKISEDFERRRSQMYEKDKDGNFKTDSNGNKIMRKGVTQANFDELQRQEDEALKAIDEQFASREVTYEAWCNQIGNLTLKQLENVLEKAKKELEDLEKNGGASSQQIATARAKVNKAQEAVKKKRAEDNLTPGKRTIKEWEDLYKTLNECARSFDDIGNAVGGAAGEIIKTAGQIATSTLSMINGIVQLVNMSATGMTATAGAASAAIQTVEKASVILAVISAALQVATAIANLFNDDDEKQEEIERLQDRIDQLQWELDHQDIVRLQQREGKAIDIMNKALAETRKHYAAEIIQLYEIKSIWERITASAQLHEAMMLDSAKRIATAYANMAYTADKALGQERFSSARQQLENLAQQQLLIQEQIEDEYDKKDTDYGQIEEWQRKIEELGGEALKLINELVEDIIGGSATDIAQELSDAFFEAFENGENAAEAWGDKVNEIVADVIKRMLVSKFLEEPLGDIFNKYKAKWFKDGNFAGIDAVINSMEEFRNDLNGTYKSYAQVMEAIPEDLRQLFYNTDSTRTAAEKGIAQASQDSVDELNGRATTIQSHTYSIAESTKMLVSNSNNILRSVQNIESNTDDIKEDIKNLRSDIKEVRDTVSDFALRGIKINR